MAAKVDLLKIETWGKQLTRSESLKRLTPNLMGNSFVFLSLHAIYLLAGVPHAGGTKCLKCFLVYFQPIRIEYSKTSGKSQKSHSKHTKPGH